jgi:putative ABC transport system substrate-binding protein
MALALAAPAAAQSGKVYRIGLLETTSASANRGNLEALLRGLREAGYTEGKNLIIDYRSADGRADRFPELADDLVRTKPDVIVTRGTPAALAAKNAGSIPIVMAAAASPLATGVCRSSNLRGWSLFSICGRQRRLASPFRRSSSCKPIP